MKAHVFAVVFIDHDDLGAEEAREIIRGDRDFSGHVKFKETIDIGDWHDLHPLNYTCTNPLVYLKSLKNG